MLNLTTLLLDSNCLCSLPFLSNFSNLKLLSLNGNRIRSLEDIRQKLGDCTQLESLDIGNNLIEDLCELHYLSHLQTTELRSITFYKNLCIRNETRDFNYRPFIYSCYLGNLSIIDGFCLSETEILKGIFFIKYFDTFYKFYKRLN